MPNLPKPAARRQRRNARPAAAVAAAKPKAPNPRKEWAPSTRAKWRAFWRSDTARVLAPAVDAHALERLFDLYDERERAYQDFRQQRFVKGSQGQEVLNPLGRLMSSLDSEIRQLEDRLGFSPAARLKLGIELPDEQPPPPPRRGKRRRDPRVGKGAAK